MTYRKDLVETLGLFLLRFKVLREGEKMGAFIVSIVSGILCCTDVISTGLAMTFIFSSLLWTLIGSWLYFRFDLFKFFYHDILGWHTPDDSHHWHDGCSEHAICKHCKRDIMQDSQGNWF